MANRKGKKNATAVSAFEEKYTLTGTVLGEGAYGKVFLGQTNASKQNVAVKLMNRSEMKHSDTSKMHKEVNILKMLNHPNVVRVIDFYDDNDYFKIVMEFVDGGELFEKLVKEEVQYTESQSRDILFTLVSALKHCKDKGVIHRDIKPENILLTKEGNIKVADFNLSKHIDPDMTDFQLLQTMCGTPNYVAPEVISGRPYDYKCDIWSLGVIMYLLLSGGYLPFYVNPDTEGRDELLEKVKRGNWEFAPEQAWANVSETAKDLLTRMLEKRAQKRITYEEILSHKWFNESQRKLHTAVIEGQKMLDQYKKRRMLEVSMVKTAVSHFQEMMGPKGADGANEGNFYESVKHQVPPKATMLGSQSDDLLFDDMDGL